MLPVSPVFNNVETVRLLLNSIGNKSPIPENKMSMLVNGAPKFSFSHHKQLMLKLLVTFHNGIMLKHSNNVT